MRNNVPDGDLSALVPPADVEERAGGLTGRVLIEQLRTSIRALEQVPVSLSIPPAPGAAPSRPACSLTPSSASNTATAASHSPLSTLHQAGLHEIKPHAYRDTPAGLGLALSVIADIQRQGPGAVLWCMTQRHAQEWGRPYGPGLVKAGLDPARVLIVETRTADEAAWALEEGLKSAALIAGLAQTEIKTPLIARRLGLAARAARTPCFLLTGHGEAKIPGTLTRWRIATEASAHIPFDTGAGFGGGTPGPACWRLSLERSRAGAATPQVSCAQVAQSAVAQERSPVAPISNAQAGQRPVAPIIREGTGLHVQAGHDGPHEPDGLRVVAASSDRAADTRTLARGPRTATG
jgi:protein ImuA